MKLQIYWFDTQSNGGDGRLMRVVSDEYNCTNFECAWGVDSCFLHACLYQGHAFSCHAALFRRSYKHECSVNFFISAGEHVCAKKENWEGEAQILVAILEEWLAIALR